MWTTKHARSIICVSLQNELFKFLFFLVAHAVRLFVFTKKTHHHKHALQQYRLYMLTICKGARVRICNTSLSMLREKLKKREVVVPISMSVKEHISIKVCEPRARKDSGPWLLHGIRNVLLWGAHCHLLMISSILKSYLHIAVFFFPQHTRTYIQEDKLAGPFLRESYATMFCSAWLLFTYFLIRKPIRDVLLTGTVTARGFPFLVGIHVPVK
jgi:hypothetical protein